LDSDFEMDVKAAKIGLGHSFDNLDDKEFRNMVESTQAGEVAGDRARQSERERGGGARGRERERERERER
jgi:hypothetical protein